MSTPETDKKCPYCGEMIKEEAVKCRFCGSWVQKQRASVLKAWTRSRRGAKVLGICAGIARQFNIDVVFVRFAFIVASFFFGLGIGLYLVLWFLMPMEEDSPQDPTA
jgi:phage shock protein PspC (stress-responsive transcriptional regulator)